MESEEEQLPEAENQPEEEVAAAKEEGSGFGQAVPDSPTADEQTLNEEGITDYRTSEDPAAEGVANIEEVEDTDVQGSGDIEETPAAQTSSTEEIEQQVDFDTVQGEQEETKSADEAEQAQSPNTQDQFPGTPASEQPLSTVSYDIQPGEEQSSHVFQAPSAPHLPTPDQTVSALQGTMFNTALNIVWSFGLNKAVAVLNLTDGFRQAIMYACSHVGVMYDFENNRQFVLQGHLNPITCTCVSSDKRWLVTGEKGPDAMVNMWDTYTGIPIQTLFDPNPEGGVVAVALTPDARYLATLSAGETQILAIWDWTIDGQTPICSADLSPSFGVQDHICFNPEDIRHLVTNSETQVLFFKWEERMIEYFAPPLTDYDFNRPVGRYSQSIYQCNSSRALTATTIGNLVVWDNNKPLTKVVSTKQSADKKALKIIKMQDRGISVLTTTDNYIVIGDQAGQVKFFDQGLKLIYWYQEMHLGPISSVSFAADPNFLDIKRENSNYPTDATIPQPKFVVRDFLASTSTSAIAYITTNGSKVQVIHQEHDAAIHALASHPHLPLIATGSHAGLLKVWNFETKQVMVSRTFDRGNSIHCCTYDPEGIYIVIGFTSGVVRILDAITLQDEIGQPFHFAHQCITQIVFAHDSSLFATADADYTTSLFQAQAIDDGDPFVYLGRYRAHYKPIREITFGIHPDSYKPRLLSLGADRVLVEYDLEKTKKNEIVLSLSDRIEQSAVPCCLAWYPQVTKEHFIVTANDQFKLKLYNATTKMCRKTLLGPTYGSPLQKLIQIPELGNHDRCYGGYITADKIGLIIFPLDGNPHNSMALIAHPSGVSDLVVSHDGRYLFTAGGADATVHMWEININALEAQSKLGGEDLIPFYGLMEGGREGELFAELEDYFYYAQIRSQSVEATEQRKVSTTIPLSEIPFVMRALGFYPSEQEIEDMMNEVKFSRYVETGQFVEELDLGTFIKLYVNHRPAFGLSAEKLQWAFDTLGVPTPYGGAVDRGELLDMLQNRGEHMTEYELADYITTLLGFSPEGDSKEHFQLDTAKAGEIIEHNLPQQINAYQFAREILGFSLFDEQSPAVQQ